MPCPPAPALQLTSTQKVQLTKIIRYPSTPQAIVLRCRVVLGAAQGTPNRHLARQLATSVPTVLLWRRRFEEAGLAGILEDRPRSGRPPQISAKKEAEIVEATRHSKPHNGTHWTVRTMARRQGVSPATVQRIWKSYRLQPHRIEHFKFSSDPEFVSKVRDIVGLYLNPPDKALVLSVDEKSQIQALDRTQPILPLATRHPGKTDARLRAARNHPLFAALNVLDGTVIGQCQPRHRHQKFLSSLDHLESSIDPMLAVHVILDNYATHKHPEVKKWFAAHPRYHVHFTPTSSSWLNQIERWFSEITSKRIRRGTFRSVRELIQAIESYIRANNKEPKPFLWTATAPAILRKLTKYKQTLGL